MRAASITAEQAANLDPAAIPAGQAVTLDLAGTRVVIGHVPREVAPGLLQGYLDEPSGGDAVRLAPATRHGFQQLLAALERLAQRSTLRLIRTAS